MASKRNGKAPTLLALYKKNIMLLMADGNSFAGLVSRVASTITKAYVECGGWGRGMATVALAVYPLIECWGQAIKAFHRLALIKVWKNKNYTLNKIYSQLIP